MSLIESTVTFETTPDFELGFQHHTRETQYFIAEPEGGGADGLVVYIPGFGKDGDDRYRQSFCRKVAEKYNLAVLTVDYHCFFSRNTTEDDIVYEAEDIALIEKLFLTFKQPFQGNTVEEGVCALNAYLAKKEQTAMIKATILPGKNEYQNGGVLQGLDIINAVQHALSTRQIRVDNVVLVGSSYGGYIANMATKIAPNMFRAVFDNSSWAHPHFSYIVGREYGISEFNRVRHSHITTQCFVRSGWTLKKNLPNTFDDNRFGIRDFSQHYLQQMVSLGLNTYYYFVHAEKDTVANTQDKINMATDLLNLGISVHMEVMGENDVDGQYVKTLDHGMNLSLLTLFDKGYKHIAEHRGQPANNFDLKSRIAYRMKNYHYVFDYQSFPVSAHTEVSE